MHGGMKGDAGPPAAARAYVEADRGRADDYYLTEGTGLARRYTATDGRVAELAPLAGEGYEAGVGGGGAADCCLPGAAGPARRYTATDGRVAELAPLAGEGYEAWVGGLDPDTGE